MTRLITQIYTSRKMFCKLITHVTLDIPLLILLQLVVVTNRSDRVIERTKGLVFFTRSGYILGQQICRCINHCVTQAGLRRSTIIFYSIRARSKHLGTGITGSETNREILERFELCLTGNVVTGIVGLLHNRLVINAVVGKRKVRVLITTVHTYRLIGVKACTTKCTILPVNKFMLRSVFVLLKKGRDWGLLNLCRSLIFRIIIQFVKISIELTTHICVGRVCCCIFCSSPFPLH